MIKLKIVYNLEYDIERVKNTISKLDWFAENNYNYKDFSFPKKLNIEKIKNYTEEEIKKAILDEYDGDSYKENENYLIKNWENISNELESVFTKISFPAQEEYIIYLTRYGSGGNYKLPNKVFININLRFNIGMLESIMHEIVHLSIQKYIDEFKIGQWQKERLVDLFFMKNFPQRFRPRTMPFNTEKIDQAFDDNYPDMKAVIKNISE